MVADTIDIWQLDVDFLSFFIMSSLDDSDRLDCFARYLGCAGVGGVDSNRYQRAESVSECLLMTS